MLNTQVTQLPYDDMYEALIEAHQGLSTEQSHVMNARLVLLLSNHIGDLAVLKQAYQLARGQEAAASQQPEAGKRAITPVAPVHAA
ncbi:MAG: DUF2783 domain-containing protein [Burkholderiales bacterium]|nr:DUF2783 domain-containing protein [Burkholderiales bacterium]